MAFDTSNETVQNEAAAWMARLRSDRRSASDEQHFQAWLARDPAHAAAFETLCAIWDAAGSYPRDLRGRATDSDGTRTLQRRTLLAGLATIPLVAAGLAVLPRPAGAQVYATRIGEQKKIVLSDDSHVFLDTDTRIEVTFSDDMRLVGLQHGRANFQVAPDKARPFVVNAAGNRIVTARSDFDVRCDAGKMSVVLFAGQASVKYAGESAPRLLTAGERLAAAVSSAITVDKPHLAPLQAWQSGRLVFEDTRLADAVAEMNRYNAVTLKIGDHAIADMRVSGIYRNGDSIGFADTIAKFLPVKVVETTDSVTLVEDGTRAKKGG